MLYLGLHAAQEGISPIGGILINQRVKADDARFDPFPRDQNSLWPVPQNGKFATKNEQCVLIFRAE